MLPPKFATAVKFEGGDRVSREQQKSLSRERLFVNY
jgi:hypothetical protein